MLSSLKDISGNSTLIQTLQQWGICHFAGVIGGGIIHVNKYLQSLDNLSQATDGVPRMFTVSEYIAGYVPLGHYLASGNVAACIVTTGAATKLASSAISDAKFHNIPALYLVALNTTFSIGNAPMQDVSVYGMNILPQLQAEFHDGCMVLECIEQLGSHLQRAQQLLQQSRPVVLVFYPDVLSQVATVSVATPKRGEKFSQQQIDYFLETFPKLSHNRRVILYVCSEAARYNNIKNLITRFSTALSAPTIWSINGANAIEHTNPYNYGYIMLGGNDKAIALWRSINKNDVVITLGFDADEYSLNLEKINAGVVWHITNLPAAYGQKDGEFKHRVAGEYYKIEGDIKCVLHKLLKGLSKSELHVNPSIELLQDFNTRTISRLVKSGRVDFAAFYESLYQLWQPHSIGFDDVCIAYKDRQYISQRPHPYIHFHSLNIGSAMGAAFGLGVGAKIADPSLHTFIFTGDGCWRLFGGALAEAANLGLRLFMIDNGCYGLVEDALKVITPNTEKSYHHTLLANIDFVAAAKACGWNAYHLKPDLSNLKEIMQLCYAEGNQSILINVPVDPDQVLGLNPRYYNLMMT